MSDLLAVLRLFPVLSQLDRWLLHSNQSLTAPIINNVPSLSVVQSLSQLRGAKMYFS